jgi:hypothetical protein
MRSTRFKSGWFWSITVANATVFVLLIALLYSILSALAAFASGLASWSLLLLAGLPVLGAVLSVASWPLTRAAPKRLNRCLGYCVNGGALLIYVTLFTGAGVIWLQTTHRTFLVPAGFQGELYVVHESRPTQRARYSFRRTTYRFPSDGILETSDPAPNIFSDEYRYLYPDGHTQKLKDAGPGTLQDTPENRANMTEIVTYFARMSPPTGPNSCYLEEISIGTRAFLLTKRPTPQPPSVTHPGICR